MRVYSERLYDRILNDFVTASNLISEENKSIKMIDNNKTVHFKYRLINKKTN